MKYSFSLLFVVLFLSCEEVQVDDLLSDFSTDNTPITTVITVDTLFESSSVSLNWTGNEYATSFSYRLEPSSYTDTIQTYTSWSNWDTLHTVTFTSLDDGNYTFYIKSRFTVDNEEAVQSIQLIVDAIAGPALRMYPLYQRVSSGETFSMHVYIEDVVDLRGVELHLSYPSSIVSANSMTPGAVLSNSSIFFDTINSTDGTLDLFALVGNITSSNNEEDDGGSDEDGSCALDCAGIFEALDADLDVFCVWLTGLGGTGAECFSDCTATFLADLDSTCADVGGEDEEDAQNDINTGVLTKLTFTAGESAGLDTLHIKDTSFLRTSLNVPIDILERVYGLIEVVE
jgi:hypothetical protein